MTWLKRSALIVALGAFAVGCSDDNTDTTTPDGSSVVSPKLDAAMNLDTNQLTSPDGGAPDTGGGVSGDTAPGMTPQEIENALLNATTASMALDSTLPAPAANYPACQQ